MRRRWGGGGGGGKRGGNSAPSITSSARERVGTVTEDSTALRTDTGIAAVFDPDNNDRPWSIHAHEGQLRTEQRASGASTDVDDRSERQMDLHAGQLDPDTNALKAGQHPTETFSVVVTDPHGASTPRQFASRSMEPMTRLRPSATALLSCPASPSQSMCWLTTPMQSTTRSV